MSDPTPPAVSDAMREAVALATESARRQIYERLALYFETQKSEDFGEHFLKSSEIAVRIRNFERSTVSSNKSDLSGPIASEIARLTGEREVAEMLLERRKVDLRAAEAETARLRAERDAAVSALKQVHGLVSEAAMTGFNYASGDWAERLFFSQADSIAVIRAAEPGYRSRAALSSQEKTDA